MKLNQKALSIVLAFGLVCGLAGLSFAEERQGPLQGACAGDVKTYCASVEKGHGGIRKCLREHREQLSQGCKDALKTKMKEHRMKKEEKENEAHPTTAPTSK